MKKTTKKLLALLSVACMATAVAGFATGCDKDKEANDSESYKIYQLYVANAEEGAEVLTYEEWLASITGPAGPAGATGATGAAGKSAYEIWLEQEGNAGKTVAEFLASLKGEPGTNGTNGTNGTDGVDGIDGVDGNDGNDGNDGASAFDLWKAQAGNEDKTLADFLAEYANPVHEYGELQEVYSSNLMAPDLPVQMVYQVCEDCGDIDIVAIVAMEEASLSTASIGGDITSVSDSLIYTYPMYDSTMQTQTTFAVASLEVDEGHADQDWKISFDGLVSGGMQVMVYDTATYGSNYSQMFEGIEIYARQTSTNIILRELPAGTYQISVMLGKAGMNSAPANATISIEEDKPSVLEEGTAYLTNDTYYTYTTEVAGTLTIKAVGDSVPSYGLQFFASHSDWGNYGDYLWDSYDGDTYTIHLDADASTTFYAYIEVSFGMGQPTFNEWEFEVEFTPDEAE